MKKIILLMMYVAFLFSEEAKFIRYPHPSPNGEQIAFNYQGDIWIVNVSGGNAKRLTVHPGHDFRPLWSPDGSRIAFISDRFGVLNVFSMKNDGSDLKRHTFTGSDYLFGWTPDSKSIIFSSKRFEDYHWIPEIYEVNAESGSPFKHIGVNAIDAVISNDGSDLYYVNGYNHRWRKRYRGSANNDIFKYNYKSKAFVQITNFMGNDLNPMPVDNGLYFISEESGFFNIHFLGQNSNKSEQITNITDDGVRYAGISHNGKIITYTNNLDVFIYNTSTKKNEKISINVSEDSPYKKEKYTQFSSRATEVEIAPNDNEFAIVYYGDIYAFKKDDKSFGRISRLTNSPFNAKDIIWGNKSDAIYFTSDKNGQYDIFKVTPKTKGPFYLSKYFNITPITETNESERNLKLSPDGNFLSFVRGLGDLIIYNLITKKEIKIIEGWNLSDYSWSPDSKWIAYSQSDNNFNYDIHIIPSKGGKAVNISQHPDRDFAPIWSPDGKKLAFSSRRYSNTYDVMYVYLTKTDAIKTKDDWDLETELAENVEKVDSNKKKKSDKNVVNVKIDFEDIHLRLKRLTRESGNEYPVLISEDNKTIYYTLSEDGNTDLFSLKEFERKPEEITSGNKQPSSIQFGSKKKQIYYKNNTGLVYSISADGKSPKSYKYRGEFTINKTEEWLQVFNEVWRIQNDNFYDENFHGANWNQIKKDYTKKVLAVRSEMDFSDVMNMLLGELNSSHQRYSGPNGSSDESYGNLGIKIEPAENGVKITEIMPNGPMTKTKIPIKLGDIITQVNGNKFDNFYQTLLRTTNDLVDIEILRGKQKFNVDARPVSAYEITNLLAYEKWTNENKAYIHAKTNNKLGYIHIKGMNWASLEEFETQLFSEAEGKDALVIDVRFNGGGSTTDYLLSILYTQEHAYTIPRGGGKGYPQDRRTFYHWTKPIIVLCNEFSYSNAEIFSHEIKNLNRGKLIGNTTFGAVISTGGQGLMNGGFVRMPFRGWYNLGSDINQEKQGAIPDYLIIPDQDDRMKNIDQHIDKAIELFNKKEM